MKNKDIANLLVAQSRVLIEIAERVQLLNVAFEAYVHDQVGDGGQGYDAHYARRKKLFDQDFSGKTKDLLSALHKAAASVDSLDA